MLILTPAIVEVKPAILEDTAPLISIVADVDDFGPAADSPLWDEWASAAAAMDAVSVGSFPF